jgi:hypothetical protein
MAGGMADVFDVVRADGFLDVDDSAAWRNLGSVEIFLESGDAGVDPKQGLIALWDQANAWDILVAFGLKEFNPSLTDFSAF